SISTTSRTQPFTTTPAHPLRSASCARLPPSSAQRRLPPPSTTSTRPSPGCSSALRTAELSSKQRTVSTGPQKRGWRPKARKAGCSACIEPAASRASLASHRSAVAKETGDADAGIDGAGSAAIADRARQAGVVRGEVADVVARERLGLRAHDRVLAPVVLVVEQRVLEIVLVLPGDLR